MKVSIYFIYLWNEFHDYPVGKIANGTQNTVPCCQKYASTDCFFGDFAHLVLSTNTSILHVSWKIDSICEKM